MHEYSCCPSNSIQMYSSICHLKTFPEPRFPLSLVSLIPFDTSISEKLSTHTLCTSQLPFILTQEQTNDWLYRSSPLGLSINFHT